MFSFCFYLQKITRIYFSYTADYCLMGLAIIPPTGFIDVIQKSYLTDSTWICSA
jgi:hypothetical protein